MVDSDVRYIEHQFEDFVPEKSNINDLYRDLAKLLCESITLFQKYVQAEVPINVCSVKENSALDFSIYDGAGGNLVLYLKLVKFSIKLKNFPEFQAQLKSYFSLDDAKFKQIFDSDFWLEEAKKCFHACLKLAEESTKAKRLQISYYFGAPGIWLQGCFLYYYLGDAKSFFLYAEKILEFKKTIIKNYQTFYYELLYGVTGYLYCLLALQKEFQYNDSIDPKFRLNLENPVIELLDLIIEQGLAAFGKVENEEALPSNFRLVYTFHDKEYFGGAHGNFGVLSIIFTAYQMNKTVMNSLHSKLAQRLLKFTYASINFLRSTQVESGNFPSSNKKKSDYNLIQFCHGSPGAVTPLLQANETFINEEKAAALYESALKAGENIWKYGLLKKGFGLCHGISGNAYFLVTLYKFTKNMKWLYRALKFAVAKYNSEIMTVIREFDFNDRYVVGKSDSPFGLLNGLGGDISLILDLFDPSESRFPGYEI